MTPEEIKKIAEGCSDILIKRTGIHPKAKSRVINDFTIVLETLTERYYLVEKGKVTKEYDGYKYLSKKHPKASERRIAEVVAKELEPIFGSEIGKEENESLHPNYR